MSKIVKTRPTQKQIAEKLGLSAATVSLALRDNPVVAKATRELVQEAMREAGYVRNLAAASLRTGRSNIIGVSLPTVAHGYAGDMLVAIERALEPSGAVILINNHDGDVEKLDRFISTLATYGADAVLVAPPPGTPVSVVERAGKHGMPMVYLEQSVEGEDESDFVTVDGRAAGRLAAAHLLEQGYEHLCMVGGHQAQIEGVREALKAAGCGWDDTPWISYTDDTPDAVSALMAALALKPGPTGIICADDACARAACATLSAAGVVPGAEIGLVGIGSERGREFTVPVLTMVCGDIHAIGRFGAEIALERLENPDSPTRRVVLDPVLMPGKTSAGRA